MSEQVNVKETRKRVMQALDEAHAREQALVPVLQSQIAMAPRGRYRKGLQMHLRETRDHARSIEKRLSELRRQDNVLLVGVRLMQGAVGQGLALGRAPLDLLGKGPLGLLRGSGGPDKVLADAKEACATEALEIAAYTRVEALAESIGDRKTARLAVAIRAEEQRMLDQLFEEIPSLVKWVTDADARGKAASAISGNGAVSTARSTSRKAKRGTRNGAARTARSTSRKAKRGVSSTDTSAKRKARTARKAPSAARAGARSRRPRAAQRNLPISNYETLAAEEVIEKLAALSQADLAKIDSYERTHENRSPVLSRIASLRGGEVSRAYDELARGGTPTMRDERDEIRAARVRPFEGMRDSPGRSTDSTEISETEFAGS